MPELPEVEVTRRRIREHMVGRTIARVRTTKNSYFFLSSPAKLRSALAGRRVVELERLGKYLIVWLDDESRFVIHLGMTGQLFAGGASSVRLLSATARASLAPEEQPDFRPDPHTHLELQFRDGGPPVWMRDVRKFGKVLHLAAGEDHPRIVKLGVDALKVSGAEIRATARKRSVAIKNLLLDQTVIAGVGNIYADESLFRAGVRPTRRARRVTERECEAIAQAIRQVMERSIETGGSSISDYVAPDGSDGRYQDERRVYARAGEPCHSCATPIRKITVGQRGTHYCARCQK